MHMKEIFIVLLVTYSSAYSADSFENENIRETKEYPESKSSFISDLKNVYRVYEECSAKELGPCLKLKFITVVDRLARKVELPIMDGISLVKDEKADNGNDMDNEVLEATLPRSLDEKNSRLDEIIADKILNFFTDRSIQFKLSGLKNMQKSLQGDVAGK